MMRAFMASFSMFYMLDCPCYALCCRVHMYALTKTASSLSLKNEFASFIGTSLNSMHVLYLLSM